MKTVHHEFTREQTQKIILPWKPGFVPWPNWGNSPTQVLRFPFQNWLWVGGWDHYATWILIQWYTPAQFRCHEIELSLNPGPPVTPHLYLLSILKIKWKPHLITHGGLFPALHINGECIAPFIEGYKWHIIYSRGPKMPTDNIHNVIDDENWRNMEENNIGTLLVKKWLAKLA